MPPPPAKKMYIQSAVFTGLPNAAKVRVAATGEESSPVQLNKSKSNSEK